LDKPNGTLNTLFIRRGLKTLKISFLIFASKKQHFSYEFASKKQILLGKIDRFPPVPLGTDNRKTFGFPWKTLEEQAT
jgi:hypothetical protein